MCPVSHRRRPPRGLSWPASPSDAFQKLATGTAVVTIVLFAVGGLVRGSGSGEGCSTWPTCFPGQLFPAGTMHSLIEFSHRVLVFLVIVLTLVTGLVLSPATTSTSVKWAAAVAFPLVLAQAVLGGIVVKTDLNPWWVTAHFIVALVFIADVTYVAVACLTSDRRRPSAATHDARFARLTLATLAAVGRCSWWAPTCERGAPNSPSPTGR